jgi:hypothetical protein
MLFCLLQQPESQRLCSNQKLCIPPSDILVVILALSLQQYPFQPKLEDGEDEDINKMISELRKRLHDQVPVNCIYGLYLD